MKIATISLIVAVSTMAIIIMGCPPPDGGETQPTPTPVAVTTVLHDFEGTAPTIGIVNWNARATVAGIAEIAGFTAGSGHGNNVMYVINGNYSAIPKLTVTLPVSTVLADYDSLSVEYYSLAGESAYKNAVLMAADPALDNNYDDTPDGSGNCIAMASNGFTDKGTWSSITFDLTVPAVQALITALSDDTFELGIGANAPNGAIFILDNISVFDGITSTVIQDFEGAAPTFGEVNWNVKACVVTIADIEAFDAGLNPSTNVMHVMNWNWGALPNLSVTLPAGTVLSQYSTITVDYYGLARDVEWKQGVLMAATSLGNTYSNIVGTDNCISIVDNGFQGKGAWGTITFDLKMPAAQTLINALTAQTFELGIGGHLGDCLYIFDNITINP